MLDRVEAQDEAALKDELALWKDQLEAKESLQEVNVKEELAASSASTALTQATRHKMKPSVDSGSANSKAKKKVQQATASVGTEKAMATVQQMFKDLDGDDRAPEQLAVKPATHTKRPVKVGAPKKAAEGLAKSRDPPAKAPRPRQLGDSAETPRRSALDAERATLQGQIEELKERAYAPFAQPYLRVRLQKMQKRLTSIAHQLQPGM